MYVQLGNVAIQPSAARIYDTKKQPPRLAKPTSAVPARYIRRHSSRRTPYFNRGIINITPCTLPRELPVSLKDEI